MTFTIPRVYECTVQSTNGMQPLLVLKPERNISHRSSKDGHHGK